MIFQFVLLHYQAYSCDLECYIIHLNSLKINHTAISHDHDLSIFFILFHNFIIICLTINVDLQVNTEIILATRSKTEYSI